MESSDLDGSRSSLSFDNGMNFKEKNWTLPKLGLLAVVFYVSIAVTGVGDTLTSDPPIWVGLIPFMFFAIFLPIYLTLAYNKRPHPTKVWSRLPFSLIVDPLPFFHLAVFACLVDFLGSVPAILKFKEVDFETLFALSCAAGGFVGIELFKRCRKIEPVGGSNASTLGKVLQKTKVPLEYHYEN